MATAEDKVLANIDKVAMSSFSPYEKVLSLVTIDFDFEGLSVSAGGTYDGTYTVTNPLGYRALPVVFTQLIWYDFGGSIGKYYFENSGLSQQPPPYGEQPCAIATVTDSQIKLYTASSFNNYGFKAYILLMEI